MTKTTATQASTGATDTDVPTADVFWLVGMERRARCFPLRFRSSTSGNSPTANDIVGPDAVRTASVCAEAAPTPRGTSPALAHPVTSYLALEVRQV